MSVVSCSFFFYFILFEVRLFPCKLFKQPKCIVYRERSEVIAFFTCVHLCAILASTVISSQFYGDLQYIRALFEFEG
uniref:Uncharacterized protein n=1 Tax=Ixodes scapularis TaxID=6945 RepID=A0A4D5RB44_IXOSC